MGRLSKANEAHIKNLQEAKARQKASVEDVTATEDPDFAQNMKQNSGDSLLEQGFFILEKDLDSDTDGNDDDNDEDAGDLKTDSDISMFSQFLAEAQLAAVKAECDAAQEQPNHKRHCTMDKTLPCSETKKAH